MKTWILLTLCLSFFLTSEIGSADVGCDIFLTPILAASLDQSQLSETSRAYLRLVQYFLDHPTIERVDKNKTIEKIYLAPNVINPYSDIEGTIGIQLSQALNKLAGDPKRVDDFVNDWDRIKTEVERMYERHTGEHLDREEKSEQTADVFSPDVIDEVTVRGRVSEISAWIKASDGIDYIAIGLDLAPAGAKIRSTNKHLVIFSRQGEKLKKVKSFETDWPINTVPVWHKTRNGRLLLAASTNGSDQLYIYEFRDGEFKEIVNIGMKGRGSSLSWNETKDGELLLAAVEAGQFEIYSLIDDSLKLEETFHQDSVGRSGLVWHNLPDGRIYLALASSDEREYLYEFKLNPGWSMFRMFRPRLRWTSRRAMRGHIWSSSAITTAPGKMYLSVTVTPYTLILLKVLEGEFVDRSTQRLWINCTSFSSVWHTATNGRIFLSAICGPNNDQIYLYELVDGQLIERSISDVGAEVTSAWRWFESTLGDIFLMFEVKNEELRFYKLIDNQFVEWGRTHSPDVRRTAPNLISSEDNNFYWLVGADNKLQLISAYRKLLSKQGPQ